MVDKTKAFHAVSGGPSAVQRLLDEGDLRPALEHTNPDVAARLCAGWVEEAEKDDSGAFPDAIQSLKDLIEERLDEIASIPPYSEGSRFDCEDFLAGDYDNVFLSVDWWHQALSTEEVDRISGFVFDAENLIMKGGMFRPQDMIDEYWQTLSDFLYKPDGRKTAEALKNRFQRVRRKYEIGGSRAIAALRRKGYEGLAEILFPGRLPLDLAIEIWENGEQVG